MTKAMLKVRDGITVKPISRKVASAFSKFFIKRLIFATVLAILMILAGLLTVTTLPVAQYPDITPPTVSRFGLLSGADAQTQAEAVGVPIEQQVNGVENMMYMSSTSGSDGSYSLEITIRKRYRPRYGRRKGIRIVLRRPSRCCQVRSSSRA